MTKPFKQPPVPVNGFTIRLWRVVESVYKTEQWRAVYHVNTPWLKVEPNSSFSGSPFTNQWAIYEGDRLVGRSDSWEWSDELWHNYFATEEEARLETVSRIDRALAKNKEEAARLLRARARLDEPTPLDVAVRQLFGDMAKNYKDYDIISGWNLKPGSLAGNTALTALDIVVQELLEKAITR